MFKHWVFKSYKIAKRVVVGIIGTTVMLVGVVLIFTPGPAMVVIPAGLAVLSLEFAWARRLLRRARDSAGDARQFLTGRNGRQEEAEEHEHSESGG